MLSWLRRNCSAPRIVYILLAVIGAVVIAVTWNRLLIIDARSDLQEERLLRADADHAVICDLLLHDLRQRRRAILQSKAYWGEHPGEKVRTMTVFDANIRYVREKGNC